MIRYIAIYYFAFFLLTNILHAADDADVAKAWDNLSWWCNSAEQSQTVESIKIMNTRGDYSMHGLGLLYLPWALVFDAIKYPVVGAAIPISATRYAITKLVDSIDDHIHDYSTKIFIKKSLEGIQAKLEKFDKYLKNKNISADGLLKLIILDTAWKSKKDPKSYLIGEKITYKYDIILKNKETLPPGSLALYGQIRQISLNLKNNNNFRTWQNTLEEIIPHLDSKTQDIPQDLKNLITNLDLAAEVLGLMIKNLKNPNN